MIKVARPVSGFSGKKLELKLEARDQGEGPQSTQTLVVVEVEASAQQIENTADTQSTLSSITTDSELGESSGLEVGQLPFSTTEKPELPANQGSLRFSSRNYNASILEGSRAPAFVQTLELLNKPADARFIQCAIASGNYRSAFHVPLNADGNCELRTMFELDREVVEHYLLNVSVQHGVHTDSTLVSVHVLDQNDNQPKFIYPTMSPSNGLDLAGYFTAISSTAPANTKVIQVKAVDADVGDNSLVHYELDASSADAKYFTVDRDTGQMVNRKRMQDVAGKIANPTLMCSFSLATV
uniref:Cadherin domain-containing protein n=1 Tax=Ditylenchus dipsaci TaxID=166011 RepID=A0A915D3F2_9BILA